jgi:Na+-translocating ferredoxin:NAD+ oxidoreductase subunit B
MDAYEKLAEKLDDLAEGFPRTETGVELKILAKLFTVKEAEIACGLSECYQTLEETAAVLNMSPDEVTVHLGRMAHKRIINRKMQGENLLYRLEPFMVGFYEHQSETIDYELAHLMEHYIQEGGTEVLMRYNPALHRVLPGSHSLQHGGKETILPYEDVIELIESGTSFAVYDCICRKQQDLIGKRTCDFPIEVCMAVIDTEIPDTRGSISKREARTLIDHCEEIGLVHTVRNVINGVDYICNCCGCCCTMLRGITNFGIENSVAKSSYHAVVSSDNCSSCESSGLNHFANRHRYNK